MLEKKHVQTILKINGIDGSSSEEEIRAVLSSARYNSDEVDAVVAMLKSGEETNQSQVDGLHKVFRSNDGLKPSEISQLLAIDVGVNDLRPARTNRETDLNEPLVFTFATVLLSAVGLIAIMYIYEIDVLQIAQTAFGNL